MLGHRASRKYVSAAVALMLATAGGVSIALSSIEGAGAEGSGFSTAQRLMAMLDSRSPGERSKADLAATKLKRKNPKLAAVTVPTQRALGKVIQPKPSTSQAFLDAITLQAPATVVPQLASLIPLGEIIAPAISTPIGIGGLVIPPVGGGGGGGGGVTPGTPGAPDIPVTPIPSAVPEPSTWLMMLLGFGAIGSTMRRRGEKRPTILPTV